MIPAGLTRTDDHRYFLGDAELIGVTAALQEGGLADFTAPWFSEAVKLRGQFVHAAIALEIEGALDDDALDPALVPYLAGWQRFVAETGVTVEYSEQPVCDVALGLAGTLDAIVCHPKDFGTRRREVIDIKPALYPSVGPQTAAYALMARHLYDAPMYFTRAALVLPGDGTYQRAPLTDRTDDALFLAALRVVHFRRAHGLGRRAA